MGQTTWKITRRGTAEAGARYHIENLSGVQVQTHPFGGFPPGAPSDVPVSGPKETFNKVTWMGDLSYKFGSAALLHGAVATGLHRGGLNTLREPIEPAPKTYVPDSLISYALGLKGRLLHGDLEYQFDGYLIHGNTIRAQPTTPDGAFVCVGNAGNAQIKARPVRHLTTTVAGSCQNACLPLGASAWQKPLNPTRGVTDDRIPDVADLRFDGQLDYTRLRVGDWIGNPGTEVSYRGSVDSYFASDPFDLPPKAYVLWNLRAGVIYHRWPATLFVHNVTTDRAQVSAINSTQDPHAIQTVQPRTIGITITRRF